MTKSQLLVRLSEAIKAAGSQVAFANKHNLTQSYLNDVLHGRRDPGPKALAALWMKKEIVYVPVKP